MFLFLQDLQLMRSDSESKQAAAACHICSRVVKTLAGMLGDFERRRCVFVLPTVFTGQPTEEQVVIKPRELVAKSKDHFSPTLQNIILRKIQQDNLVTPVAIHANKLTCYKRC